MASFSAITKTRIAFTSTRNSVTTKLSADRSGGTRIMANEAEKIVNDFCRAFESKNLEAIMAFFTEDAVYHNIPMKPVSGKAAIRTTIQSFMPKSDKDTITFKILHTSATGNVVFNERVDMFDTN